MQFDVDVGLACDQSESTTDTKADCALLSQVHEYLRSKLCSLYENDCIFDKFECVWNSSDR